MISNLGLLVIDNDDKSFNFAVIKSLILYFASYLFLNLANTKIK